MGFGLLDSSYCETPDSVCMGLTQGSGAAPSVWTAISTVILGPCKTHGYGASLSPGWSGTKVSLLVFMYVDNTDLLYRPHQGT